MSKLSPISKLVATLLPEALQAETSAAIHCGREAERLGGVPAGVAMRAVAEHAERTLPDLRDLVEGRGQKSAYAGRPIGRTLSSVRELATDIVISQEKSYRGTLLGIHHGLVTFMLLEDAATATSEQVLADFCSEWLAERATLTATVERDLAWFAQNPQIALSRATPPLVKKLGRTLPLLNAFRARAWQPSTVAPTPSP